MKVIYSITRYSFTDINTVLKLNIFHSDLYKATENPNNFGKYFVVEDLTYSSLRLLVPSLRDTDHLDLRNRNLFKCHILHIYLLLIT